MTLQSSGAISLAQIASEFSGNPTLNSGDYPLELGEYRGQDNAPTTGAISFSDFYGDDGVPSSGLQYHYDGQISETTTGSGGVEDISINNRTATLTSGAAYNSGDFGKVVFDGTDDYVVVSSYKGITGRTARTSIVFYKLDTIPASGQARILAWGNYSTSGSKWTMAVTNTGALTVGVSGGYNQTISTYSTGQWNMFSATAIEGDAGIEGVGQQTFTSSTNWTVPAGVYSVSAVVVGGGGGGGGSEDSDETGGGGGGGGLAYVNNLSVTPGESLTVTVGTGGNRGGGGSNGSSGGFSALLRGGTTLARANGGGGGQHRGSGGSGGTVNTGTGGSGGQGGAGSDRDSNNAGGGGGAGGYSGAGGRGCDEDGSPSGGAGSGGGGGGGGRNDGGGGVDIFGEGSDGSGGGTSNPGGLGSGGNNGSSGSGTGGDGGDYGGGGGGGQGSDNNGGNGGDGVVRIIWGSGRSYPTTNTTNSSTVTGVNPTGGTDDIIIYNNATKLLAYTTSSQLYNTESNADVSWGGSLADSSLSPMDGEIAKVLIYNRELTHAEIAQIYNAKCVALGLSQASATTESPFVFVSSATSVNEGSTISFTISNYAFTSSQTLYYTLDGVSGTVNSSDFSAGTTSGSFSMTPGQDNTLNIGVANDGVTESSETFKLNVRTTSISGTIIGSSDVVTIVNVDTVPIAYVTGTTSQTTSISLSGIQSGDLLLLFGATDSGNMSGTDPSGWSELTTNNTSAQPDNDNVPDSMAYYRFATGTSQSVTGLNDPNSGAVYVMMAFRNVNSTTPFNATTQETSGGTGNPDSPSITTSSDGCMIVSVGFLDDDDSAPVSSAPSGFTLGPNEDSGANNGAGATLMTAYLLQSSAGSINPGGFSSSGNDAWKAYTIALNPQ